MEPNGSADTPALLPAAHRYRTLWQRAAVAAVVVIVLWSAAWFYAPPLIRSQLQQAASAKLGRTVTVAAVSFNPWTLELDLSGLEIAAAAGSPPPPQLRIERIHADAALLSLFRLAPVIDRLEIEAPQFRLARLGDGRFDIDDILRRLVAKEGDEPARFAVHNIVVSRGSADFDDVPVQAKHRLRDLELAVPFISSLPSEREIKVEPRLAFALDGSRFDSAAVAAPYGERGAGEATLLLKGVDVAPWLGYVPKTLPVKLQSALLNADLRLAFEQRPKLSLRVSGTVEIGKLKLADAAAGELLDAGNIRIEIDELRPLEGLVRLRRIAVDAPHLLAVRSATGKVNLLLEGQSASGATAPVAPLPKPTSAASAARALRAASSPSSARGTSAPGPRWKVIVAALSVRAGTLDWRDAAVAPAAALAVKDFVLDATALQWPLDAPVVFKGEGALAGAAGRGRIAFAGQGNAAGARVEATIDAVPLALAAPYVRAFVAPPLDGVLDARVAVEWKPGDGAPRLIVDAQKIAVASLKLGDAKAPEVAADRIEIAAARVDTAARSLAIGRLALTGPRLRLERDREQRWSFERWRAAPTAIVAGATATAIAAPVTAAAPASVASAASGAAVNSNGAWTVAVDELAIDKGRVGFSDRGLAEPVALDVTDLAVQLKGYALDSKRVAPFLLRARLAVPAGPTGVAVGSGFAGSIDTRGELGAFAAGVPGSARAELLLKDLPLHLLDPYLDDFLDIDIQKAQTSFKGDASYEAGSAGPRLRVRGDAAIDDFRANSAQADRGAPQRSFAMVQSGPGGRQLLSWKTMTLRGIDVGVAPGAATEVVVAETAVSDFFARVVLDETGRLNLQDMTRPAPAASGPAASASAPKSPASPAAIVRFGPIAVVGGRVNFNDRFVKPNYSANLSELSGRLGAFSSQGAAPGQAPLLADLALTGRVEGTATLEIAGQVNPLAKPLALDVKATVRDLELPPLSPYAVKYAGYGIERGKMSVDLAYLVKPDGQLTATNKIVLHQLAFGDKVEGAPASLPVKLAVALLSDRHGVIDLDLPIGGSINDPQFSIGALIWKAIASLIVKAVTAPFSLLASALGGSSSELSTIEFAPGTATLLPAARASLDKIAAALADRPQLTMTVIGESRIDVEREAWKKERLQQIVRAEKRRASLAAGAATDDEITLSEVEYPPLLKEVYKRADIVKPKNVVGLAKDLPTNEMEALLLAGIKVSDDAMQQLAVRRGVVVRDYLAARQLPTSRLFLGAPKTAAADVAWTPRADLKLTTE